MGLVLELLSADAGDDNEAGGEVGESGEVAPEFFELGDGKHVFLAVTPAAFDLLEGDVGGDAGGEAADGGGDGVGGGGGGGE